jgi:FkbM family methyltransferase
MLIPFDYLLNKFNLKPTGIFHVGANLGQEADTYWNMGIKRMVFIEALPDIFEQLCENVRKYQPYVYNINACVSDKDDEVVTFNVANNEGQSSSMLVFDTHTAEHPTVQFVDVLLLKTKRLDTLIRNHHIALENYDMLNMDLQGAELLALKGMGEQLKKINSIYIEVNEKHLYLNCPLIADIDEYLLKFDFVRVETKMLSFGWGDALYTKSK